jgi:pyrroloquinoline quinone (PQQ) biosynthesis protein C
MWSDLVRRAEPDFVASPANLLAICALRAGNGLLANLAVARAIDAEPDNHLAHLLRHAIDAGISPDEVAALLLS